MASILSDFERAVTRNSNKTAIVDGKGRETTFAELKARSESFAHAWRANGVKAGDRVLIAMNLDADLYAALAALWSLGATAVLPEPAMGLKGLRHAASVANVSAFCSSGLYRILRFFIPELWRLGQLTPSVTIAPKAELITPKENDIALISFTSGSTGAPKAIPRSHGFLNAQHKAIAPLLNSEKPQRDLVAFPVFVLINIASGQTSILPSWKMSRISKLEPRKLASWIEKQQASRLLLPPALCEKLAQANIPFTVHTVFVGGGPVFPDMISKLKTHSTLNIICVYGSTEAEPIAHLNAQEISHVDFKTMQAGAGLLVGKPVDDIQVRIVDDEIQVAGAHVNDGYLDPKHDVENKVKDGPIIWHRTGDAGYLDDAGRLWLLGRMGSEVLASEGRVYPFSIEVAARDWQGVVQCALIELDGAACLVIEGDTEQLPSWRDSAKDIGIPNVRCIEKIPMDLRHASKVDRKSLQRILNQ